MIKRYEGANPVSYMIEHTDGDYVLFEDHQREVDNLKCCGNCGLRETMCIDPFGNTAFACTLWEHDGLTQEDRRIK